MDHRYKCLPAIQESNHHYEIPGSFLCVFSITYTMKLVIVVPDGMCDWRYPALDNLSPAEYAYTPGLDKIVQSGRVGLVRTMYDGLPLGSLVGLLGIL